MKRQTADRIVGILGDFSLGMILIAALLALAGKYTAVWQAVIVIVVAMAAGIFVNVRYNIEEK